MISECPTWVASHPIWGVCGPFLRREDAQAWAWKKEDALYEEGSREDWTFTISAMLSPDN